MLFRIDLKVVVVYLVDSNNAKHQTILNRSRTILKVLKEMLWLSQNIMILKIMVEFNFETTFEI